MGGIIHVGGWEGLEYIGSSRRLLIFEPQADAFAALERNLPDAECVNLALGSAPGVATMNTARPSHSSSLLPCLDPPADGVRFDGAEIVRVSTLDREMRRREGFDELRIDTQGYELEVLKGAVDTLKTIRRVEVEIHRTSSYPGAAQLDEIDGFLIPLGFKRTMLDAEGSDDLCDATYERPS